MEGRDCYTCAERHARRARRSEMGHPTLGIGRDKRVPPKGGPDRRVPPRGNSELGKYGKQIISDKLSKSPRSEREI